MPSSKPKTRSLSRRIIAAFIVFGIVLSVFFAVLAAVAVEGIEVHLVDERLGEVEKWALPRDAAGLEVSLPAGLEFLRGDAIPAPLRNLPDGISSSLNDGMDLHVLSGYDRRGPYVVIDHESDYEEIELLVYSMFAAFFAGFVLLAAMLGGYVGRRIVLPMKELAGAVERGVTPLPLTDRQDEIGFLARALDAHTAELRAFLDRERFFTGDVSHELRTPLTVIVGAAEILLQEGQPAALRAPAERIYRAAQEATECITVLLLLARAPELGQFALASASDIARQETERYQNLVAGKPVVLGCVGDASVAVRAPAELCASAIGNLIRNACQHTEQGHITVRLEPGAVTVEDTGPGLSSAVRETLGQRDRAMPSTGSAGTGLGLSLVRRICEYLGARLEYEDRLGGGTVFRIVFPAVGPVPER